VHALTNTFSGVAGEARIAAEFVRCGFRVADPYWTDDEVDLLVLEREENLAVPLSIQVKSVQFLPDRNQKIPTHAFTQGLKKRYVTKSPAFALAIYLVDTDEIFFIDGPANIRRVYEAQGPGTRNTLRSMRLAAIKTFELLCIWRTESMATGKSPLTMRSG